MPFLSSELEKTIKDKISSDETYLKKLYKVKQSPFLHLSVVHSLVEDYVGKGWEIESELKTKTKIKKRKEFGQIFEDEIWCQLYELGYRTLNIDDKLFFPFDKGKENRKQIDIFAINEETALIVECKAAKNLKRPNFLKDQFELLSLHIDGFNKTVKQIYGERRIKFIYATKNLRINPKSVHVERLNKTNSYLHDDNSFMYLNSLIKNYKNVAHYQFLGILFRNQIINKNTIELPALEGKMGGLKYYMFSIEPSKLLKMGFILHRTRANASLMPTYQRLLVPSRLKGITKFIDGENGKGGGFFPNSIIVNFNDPKQKLKFNANSPKKGSVSRSGKLNIPNTYSIAYIIDGQHRLYGYANSKFSKTDTIPVVAFVNLSNMEQLEMFMNINQNQKAVSPSLKLTLEEDLYWNSKKADQRLKALNSAIVKRLGTLNNSPLYNKVSIGEDSSILKFKPLTLAIRHSGLIPQAKGNQYSDKFSNSYLYNIANQNHDEEMNKCRIEVSDLIIECLNIVEENFPSVVQREDYFVTGNRGLYAFINSIGSLNGWLHENGSLSKKSSVKERVDALCPYIEKLISILKDISKSDEDRLYIHSGEGSFIKWFRFYQLKLNEIFPKYNPPELIEWKERNDAELQARGRIIGVQIEKVMKKVVLSNIQKLFEEWEMEINPIKRKCIERAETQMEAHYKEFGEKKEVPWTDMFDILDYKKIIEKFWSKTTEDDHFKSFDKIFAIDVGLGFKSKSEKIKWISKFNSLRNSWAHAGSKSHGLSSQEVEIINKIHSELINNIESSK